MHWPIDLFFSCATIYYRCLLYSYRFGYRSKPKYSLGKHRGTYRGNSHVREQCENMLYMQWSAPLGAQCSHGESVNVHMLQGLFHNSMHNYAVRKRRCMQVLVQTQYLLSHHIVCAHSKAVVFGSSYTVSVYRSKWRCWPNLCLKTTLCRGEFSLLLKCQCYVEHDTMMLYTDCWAMYSLDVSWDHVCRKEAVMCFFFVFRSGWMT